MSSNGRHSHRRKKKSFIRQFVHDIKKSFKNLSSNLSNKPKEYRPYLGPAKQESEISGSGENEFAQDEIKISKHRSSHHRRKPRRKGNFISNTIKKYKRKWKTDPKKRKKKKYKQRIKKKHKLEYKKRARINLIRKLFPEYKKTKHQPFIGVPDDETGEIKKTHQKGYFIYAINSVALYVIAYLLVYLIYQLTVLIVSSRWKLDSVLFYYDLAFNDYSPLWSRFNIIMVTLSGPLICLLIGILFLKIFANKPKVKGFMKLFILWIAMHGFNLFFGAFASGVSFDAGFGYVPAWLYFNVFWQIFVSLLFLFILGLIGYNSVPKFLDTSNSAYRVRKQNRVKFLFYQVIIPWLIGGLIIFFVKIPNNMPYDTGNLITMVFCVIPVLFNTRAKPNIKLKGEKKPTRINWIYIAVFVILLSTYRISLNSGLYIKLDYNFNISLDIKRY